MHGSDVIQTGWALGTIEGTELVIAGNEATDGVGEAVRAVIAEYLGLPPLPTCARCRCREAGSVGSGRPTKGCSPWRRHCPRWSA
jgi:electron transfer flavoprotein beta subunit